MASYANSAGTKMALILAAGELFAEHGIDAVTMRAIADKANENLGIIHYHFGSKEGLIKAVMDFAGEPWKENPLGKMLEENRGMLSTREGQEQLVSMMTKRFLEILFSSKQPAWCCRLGFQIIQRDLEVSRHVFNIVARSNIEAYMQVYQSISGDQDPERAFNWAEAALAPAVLAAVNPMTAKWMLPENAITDQFQAKLEEACLRNVRDAVMSIRPQIN